MSSKIAFGGCLFFWQSKRKVKGLYETNRKVLAKLPFQAYTKNLQFLTFKV
jgi:hypothetical protein